MFYTCNYNIRVTHIEMVLLSIFYTNQDPRRIISRLFFIHFVAPCACSSSSGWNITSNLLCEDLSTLALHTSVGCISLQNASRTALCYGNQYYYENIPNIWHKSSTNTRRSDQIETIKTIMQTTRPRITWKVLSMAQVAIFKRNIRSSAKRFRLWIVLSEPNVTTSHIIFTI